MSGLVFHLDLRPTFGTALEWNMPPFLPETDFAVHLSTRSAESAQGDNSNPSSSLFKQLLTQDHSKTVGRPEKEKPPQIPISEAEQLTALQAELAALRHELAELRQEKVDLEILLEATAEHSDSVEAELHNTAIAALKQSEAMFRTIAEATPVPVLIGRIGDSEILYANSAAGFAFGRSAEALVGCQVLDFYAGPVERQVLVSAFQSDDCVHSYELQFKREDGELFWVAASLRQLIFDHEPIILMALCDITQRKQEAEALKRQIQEMQIEIDQAKRAQQVTEIIQSDYFQQLQTEVELLRQAEEEW